MNLVIRSVDEPSLALDSSRGRGRAVTFFLARELLFGARDMPEGLVLANGRIEGDPLYVNSKVAGRIVDLPVEEGEVLAAGALIARLDDAAARERLEQARQRVLALEARIAAAESAFSLSQAQLPLEIVLNEMPRTKQTPEERVKTVFAVKVFLDANPEHRYAPGMPADVVIRWKDEVPWQPPRW